MRHLLVTAGLLLTTGGYSQNSIVIDSLNSELKKSNVDSIVVAYHYELCYQWAAYNADSATTHASKMAEIAEGSGNPFLTYQSIEAKGLVHDFQYNADSAIFYYKKAKDIAADMEYPKGVAISTFNIGVVYYYSGQMGSAIDHYLEAEKVFLQINDQRNLGVIYNNLGLIYRHTKKYALARDYYLKSLTVKRDRDDINGVMNTLTNLSTIYQLLDELEKAQEASEEVIAIAKEQNNAGAYLSELINLGKIFITQDQSEKALTLYQEAEGMLSEESPFAFKTEVFHQLSNFYVERKEPAKAKKYLDLVKELVADDQLDVKMNHFLTESKYYHLVDRNELAYLSLQEAFNTREELFDKEVLEKTTELEQLYEKEKRELEIDRLNTENELKSLSIEKQNRERNGLIILGSLALGVSILLYVLFKQKQKSLSERETLLKEIHHRVKNNLQIISSLLNLQAGSLEDEVAIDAVKEGQNRVKSMALIHENLYRSDNLSGISVDSYVENLKQTLYSSFGIDEEKIETHLEIEKLMLDIDTLIPIGLILNELISNSLKYAFPNGEGNLTLSLTENQNTLEMKVKDDGPGLSEKAIKESNSYGWKMINSLSRKLKADISIDSNNGTEIMLKIKNYQLVA